MDDETLERTRDLLTEHEATMERLFAFWGDHRKIAKPRAATDSELDELEDAIGAKLDPTYKAFLMTNNGYPRIDGDTTFLSAHEVINELREGPSKALTKVLRVAKRDDFKNWLTLARAPQDETLVIANFRSDHPDGEWEILDYDAEEGIEGQGIGFLKYLIELKDETAQAELDAKNGPIFTEDDM